MSYEIRNANREEYVTGECITRKMTDEERLKYGRPRPTTKELYWILKNPQKAAEYQNTYGLSNQEMTELRQCLAQQGYEKQLYAMHEKAKSQTVEIDLETPTSELLEPYSDEEVINMLAELVAFGNVEDEEETEYEKGYSEEQGYIEVIPFGLHGEAIVVGR